MKVKKLIAIMAAVLLLFSLPISRGEAAEQNVYEKYQKDGGAEKADNAEAAGSAKPSVLPYALQFIGSFLLILILLYFVLRYLAKRTNHSHGGGVFHGIGGHPLGSNRSVQLLMVGDTLYILGVGETITLIRMIPPGEEQTKLLESVAEKPVDVVADWGAKLKKTSQEKWKEMFLKQLKDGIPGKGRDNNDH